jgi:hypothetical protein
MFEQSAFGRSTLSHSSTVQVKYFGSDLKSNSNFFPTFRQNQFSDLELADADAILDFQSHSLTHSHEREAKS